jgi:hypothetical protein
MRAAACRSLDAQLIWQWEIEVEQYQLSLSTLAAFEKTAARIEMRRIVQMHRCVFKPPFTSISHEMSARDTLHSMYYFQLFRCRKRQRAHHLFPTKSGTSAPPAHTTWEVSMSAYPSWFEQLKWSQAWPVAVLKVRREEIPKEPGCYVFTDDDVGLRPDHVLYIGKAKILRNRLGGYLVDYKNTLPTKHKGRAFIFQKRHEATDRGIYVRWVQYGGNPGELETNLCDFLWPHFTDRWEIQELWDDDVTIVPRLIF